MAACLYRETGCCKVTWNTNPTEVKQVDECNICNRHFHKVCNTEVFAESESPLNSSSLSFDMLKDKDKELESSGDSGVESTEEKSVQCCYQCSIDPTYVQCGIVSALDWSIDLDFNGCNLGKYIDWYTIRREAKFFIDNRIKNDDGILEKYKEHILGNVYLMAEFNTHLKTLACDQTDETIMNKAIKKIYERIVKRNIRKNRIIITSMPQKEGCLKRIKERILGIEWSRIANKEVPATAKLILQEKRFTVKRMKNIEEDEEGTQVVHLDAEYQKNKNKQNSKQKRIRKSLDKSNCIGHVGGESLSVEKNDDNCESDQEERDETTSISEEAKPQRVEQRKYIFNNNEIKEFCEKQNDTNVENEDPFIGLQEYEFKLLNVCSCFTGKTLRQLTWPKIDEMLGPLRKAGVRVTGLEVAKSKKMKKEFIIAKLKNFKDTLTKYRDGRPRLSYHKEDDIDDGVLEVDPQQSSPSRTPVVEGSDARNSIAALDGVLEVDPQQSSPSRTPVVEVPDAMSVNQWYREVYIERIAECSRLDIDIETEANNFRKVLKRNDIVESIDNSVRKFSKKAKTDNHAYLFEIGWYSEKAEKKAEEKEEEKAEEKEEEKATEPWEAEEEEQNHDSAPTSSFGTGITQAFTFQEFKDKKISMSDFKNKIDLASRHGTAAFKGTGGGGGKGTLSQYTPKVNEFLYWCDNEFDEKAESNQIQEESSNILDKFFFSDRNVADEETMDKLIQFLRSKGGTDIANDTLNYLEETQLTASEVQLKRQFFALSKVPPNKVTPNDVLYAVTGDKLFAFLSHLILHRKNRNTNEAKGIGSSHVCGFRNALIALYKVQRSRKRNWADDPTKANNQAVGKLLEVHGSVCNRDRLIENVDKQIQKKLSVIKSFSDMRRWIITAVNARSTFRELGSLLRDTAMKLLDHVCVLRGHAAREIDLSDLTYFSYEEDLYKRNHTLTQYKTPMMIVGLNHDKSVDLRGKIQIRGAIRHVDPSLCVVFWTSAWLFWRYHVNAESKPCYLYNKNWYKIKAFSSTKKDANPTKQIHYNTHYNAHKGIQNHMVDDLFNKATHDERGSGANKLHNSGCDPGTTALWGGWVWNCLSEHYLAINPVPMRVLGGFEKDQKDLYHPRWDKDMIAKVPNELLVKIFPWVDEDLAHYTPMRKQGYTTTVAHLELLKWFRIVFLTDSVIMMDEYPELEIWRHEVFLTEEYKEWSTSFKEYLSRSMELSDCNLAEKIENRQIWTTEGSLAKSVVTEVEKGYNITMREVTKMGITVEKNSEVLKSNNDALEKVAEGISDLKNEAKHTKDTLATLKREMNQNSKSLKREMNQNSKSLNKKLQRLQGSFQGLKNSIKKGWNVHISPNMNIDNNAMDIEEEHQQFEDEDEDEDEDEVEDEDEDEDDRAQQISVRDSSQSTGEGVAAENEIHQGNSDGQDDIPEGAKFSINAIPFETDINQIRDIIISDRMCENREDTHDLFLSFCSSHYEPRTGRKRRRVPGFLELESTYGPKWRRGLKGHAVCAWWRRRKKVFDYLVEYLEHMFRFYGSTNINKDIILQIGKSMGDCLIDWNENYVRESKPRELYEPRQLVSNVLQSMDMKYIRPVRFHNMTCSTCTSHVNCLECKRYILLHVHMIRKLLFWWNLRRNQIFPGGKLVCIQAIAEKYNGFEEWEAEVKYGLDDIELLPKQIKNLYIGQDFCLESIGRKIEVESIVRDIYIDESGWVPILTQELSECDLYDSKRHVIDFFSTRSFANLLE